MNLARHYQTLGLRRGALPIEVKAAYRKLVRQYHPDLNPDEAAVEQFIKINDAYTVLLKAIASGDAASCGVPSLRSIHQFNGFHIDSRLHPLMQTLEKMGLVNLRGNQNACTVYPGGDPEGDLGGDPATGVEPVTNSGSPHISSPHVSSPHVSSPSVDLPDAVELPTQKPAIEPIGSDPKCRPLSEQEEALKQEAYQQLKGLLGQQKFPRAIALVEGLAHRMPTDAEIIQWQAIVYQRWGRKLVDEGQTQKARIYLKKALRTDPNNPSLWREVNRDFWQLATLAEQSSSVST